MNSCKTIFFAISLAIFGAGLISCGSTAGDEPDPYVTDASVAPSKTSLEAGEGSTFVSVKCTGGWTLDLSYPSGSQGGWARVNPASGNGNKGDVRFSYDANDDSEARSVTLVLKPSNGKQVSATVTQAGKASSTPDNPTPVTPTPGSGNGVDVAGAGWLELPATVAGDGRDFFAHDMTGAKYVDKQTSGQRNWSFYYDYKAYDAVWVAYPLNKGLIGSGSRTDAWGFDPLLPSDNQQSIVNGAYGTGHSRGHQIPSADRLSYAANVTTFYATNMTPQDYNFNGGIWADLEGKVRSYASKSDTCYVVTGCVLDASSESLTDRGGHIVTIPSAYFKAILRYMPGSNVGGYGGYIAAGFCLPHSSSIAKGKFIDYIMSIDELEKKTGIDFFVNLPSVVGQANADRIEAESPVDWWKN